MPSLLPVSADVSTVPKSEVLTISDPKEPVPKKPRRHTRKSVAKEALGVEASASAGSGGTGAEGRKKHKLLRGIDSSHGSDAQTAAAKRTRHQNLVRRRVRHLHRLKPAERSGGGKGTTAGLQRRSATEGRGHGLGPPFIWAWAGLVQGLVTEGTKLGELLAPLSDHMEQLNKLSIEERCGMVKHFRIDKTFQPQRCRVTLAVETPHLRYAVGKALEALQVERKQGQGLRTALARELQDWLEVMK